MAGLADVFRFNQRREENQNLNATALITPPFPHIAETDDDALAPSPLNFGKRYWQRALLAVTVLQLKLRARTSGTSVGTLWLDQTLQSLCHTELAPQTVARMLTIVQTCGYDAWSAYDPIALGTQLGGSLRRPSAERTDENRAKAFSYGAYRALLDLFPEPGQQEETRDFMDWLGYDPDDNSTDTTTPAGIGNVAGAAVLASAIRTAPVIWEI